MKYKSILFLIALGLIASVVLTFIPIDQACGQEDNGCYAVQTSQYETTLGFQNAHLGLVAFSVLFIITFLHDKRPTKKRKQFIQTGLILGSAFAIYFLYLQFFIINAVCKYCMVTDIGILASLAIFFFVKDKKEQVI
ncbi:MAG: vitamin K epoxide reductase family protein [Nanoarchaeota archaeon]|jgi:uncharacterized membrane protein|nr:vitamin K epoxide reductase family protein [Nanoarchaeota archaeon]